MIEEIEPGMYRVEIPLPGNPLKSVNSYLIQTRRRNLIIDTGMNIEACLGAMRSALRELAVDLEKTDFFITHLHADHLGLVPKLAADSATVYLSQPDAELIAAGGRWEESLKFFSLNGFPASDLRRALNAHPGYRYTAQGSIAFTSLKNGELLRIGCYRFECVATPGHTAGHTCLYEPRRKMLFSGDHILGDITPNIAQWFGRGNPLRDYLASLEMVAKRDVALALPGHRSIFHDCRGRIRELQRHHRARADEILEILKSGGRNAYQTASCMSWELDCDSWDEFPLIQKMFATGEAIAHLTYLAEKGLVRKEQQEREMIFSLA